jgi:hypothetical protein
VRMVIVSAMRAIVRHCVLQWQGNLCPQQAVEAIGTSAARGD